MRATAPAPKYARRRPNFTPIVVLGTSLLLTALVTYVLTTASSEREQSRFLSNVQSTEDRIRTRLEIYIALLRGTAALYAASETVSPEEFRAYIERLRIKQQYPGVQGIGSIQRVPMDQRAIVEEQLRGTYPNFHIGPDSTRLEFYPTVFLEPLDAHNRSAIGEDMFTDPLLRDAMERARDGAEPAISGKVPLHHEGDSLHTSGFLIFVPVFEWPEIPGDTARRRSELTGFVFSPLDASGMFADIFGSEESPSVHFRAYDAVRAPETLLYDSDPELESLRPALVRTGELRVAGRTWVIEYEPTKAFLSTSQPSYEVAVALAGIALSLLLYMATRAQARAQQRAERSERTRSRFLAAMSHELRTPLNAIMGYNDLLLANVFGPLSTAQETGITRSQKAAHHLLELVNDVLDLSKIEAGKIEVVTEPVGIAKLIDDLLTTIRPMVTAAGSEIVVDCDHTLAPITTDPRRVRQILLNLISNAAKYGGGNPIRVSCESTTEGGVSISVADRGSGIAPKDLTRIFDEFVQIESKPGQGTGLGLAISNRLAHTLGGSLHVESVLGKGSTFWLRLPARV